MKNLLTKNNILLGSVIGLALACVFDNPIFFHFCVHPYTWENYVGCTDKLPELLSMILMGMSPAILLSSLITYKMRDEIFTTWKLFSLWFVPISALLIFSASGGGGGWGVGFGNEQEKLAIFFPILYLVVSLAIIVYKYLHLNDKK